MNHIITSRFIWVNDTEVIKCIGCVIIDVPTNKYRMLIDITRLAEARTLVHTIFALLVAKVGLVAKLVVCYDG